tara:strand:- start:520 stop:759 length:240 start_codon:yes stop_codon:yes gene_type:complete
MNFVTYILIKLIIIYKYLISPIISPSCRYLPTCSEYSIEALKTFGFFKGLSLSIKRIFSCHPWSSGGFDPVKKEIKAKK